MDFRILGPLEVLENGQALDLGAQKQRTLLAALLLHANEVVSQDRLIEALWEDEAPDTAQKALQVYVSGLRKTLGRERLQTKAPGYLLQVEEDELDLERFRRLSEEGRPREALALWRGPPLSDFAYQRFAQSEIDRLEELRLTTIEERIEADLARGAHAELVGELEALVKANPLRERLRGQLMLALYRSGRQAEALEAYQQARAALVEELGIEPGRQLRELHQAILKQDPSLDIAAGAETATDASRTVFVGREPELAELLKGLDGAIRGRARLFLLQGEPGIGKSRLVDELIAHARARGARVLVGRCWEAGGAPAYWPWVQALRGCLRDREPSELREELGAGASDLAQLLPELREILPGLPEPAAPESEGARFRLFEAVSSFLRNTSHTRPLLLTLDDLHAADEPSLLLVQFVAREMTESRLLLLGAYRDVDPTVSAPLAETVAELLREPLTQRISLSGLAEPEVARYIELVAGHAPDTQLVDAIHGETEGNPLFVSQIVQLVVAEGDIDEARPLLRVPEGLRDVIGRRLRRLSGECQRVLILASVLGREFGLEELARLSDLSQDELFALLDEAMAERIVSEAPAAPGRLRFAHVLIRDTAYDSLTAARRLQLHRQAGEALEAVYARDPDPHLAELAHHFVAAAPAGHVDKAIAYSRRAGDRAAGLLAYEEAVRLYGRALLLVENGGARCDLLLALGDAQARAGDTPTSKSTYREAAELAEALNLPEQLARAALGYGGRIVWEVSRDDAHLVSLLERALAALGEGVSPLRVRILARLAGGPLRDASFPPERKAALSEQALEMARRIGDPATLAYALAGYIPAHHSPDHTHQHWGWATELIEVAMAVDDLERAVEGYEHRGQASIELGDFDHARDDLEAMAKLAEALRQPSQDWFVAELRAQHALLRGTLVDAERLIYEALELGQRAQRWNALVSYRIQLYLLRKFQGRLEELDASAFEYPTYPVSYCILAGFYDELGRAAEASKLLETLAADEFSGVPFDEEWLLGMSLLAEVACSLGDTPRTVALYEKLEPYSDRVAVGYSEICTGSVSRYLGLLAATMGRFDDAVRHFEDGLEMNERIGARPWLAHTQDDYGRMLLERGETERASELIAAAIATYRELGMETYAVKAQELVEAYAKGW